MRGPIGPAPLDELWLRWWHASQALLFLGLAVSGARMHWVEAAWIPLSFRQAVLLHNVLGPLLVVSWLVFAVANQRSGNRRHYGLRKSWDGPGLRRQLAHYTVELFGRGNRLDGGEGGSGRKFNVAQALSYSLVMDVLLPVSWASGVLLLFPMLAPERALGLPGLMPMAMIHLAAGYLLTIFLIVHIYMAGTMKGH